MAGACMLVLGFFVIFNSYICNIVDARSLYFQRYSHQPFEMENENPIIYQEIMNEMVIFFGRKKTRDCKRKLAFPLYTVGMEICVYSP
jgi:hypothetical protein